MPHRYVSLPFKAAGFGRTSPTEAVVAIPAISARVDLVTGTIVSESEAHEYARAAPPDPSRMLGDLTERAAETPAGPVTDLSNGATHLRFEGELSQAWRNDRFFVAVVSGMQWECVATVLGETAAPVRLPSQRLASLTGDGDFAACAFDECLHVFRFDASAVRSISVAIPASWTTEGPEVFVTGSRVCVVSGDKLLIIEATELEFELDHHAREITYEPLVDSSGGETEPAIVAFVLAESILLDHPTLKRLRVQKTAETADVAKGDQVIIDAVREELPGIFRVDAWHKVGAEKSTRPLPPTLELPPPTIEVRSAEVPAPLGNPKTPDFERLAALASRHGFRVPELLMRILRLRASDMVFRRWLDKLGFDGFDIRALTADWDADPNLIAFLGLGNGDEYSLYVYPPWCNEGHEPPIVEYLHETNFVDFRALTFEAFFDSELETRADDDDDDAAELVSMVRRRLEFPRAERDVGTAPAWLPLDSGRQATPQASAPSPTGIFGSLKRVFSKAPSPAMVKSPMERALDDEKAGNVLSAERAFLTLFLAQGEGGSQAGSELRRIYAQLGWTLALENIESSLNVAC